MTPKLKIVYIFSCPECRKQKFASIRAVNIHLTKAHRVNYKIYINDKGRACVRRTLKINVLKPTITNYF